MARRKTPARRKDGRFKKATKSRARRNPPSKYRSKRRSTRRGMVRKTARRAYEPKPRRKARKNKPMFTPAVRYSLLGGGGSIAGFWADKYQIPGVTALANQIPLQAVTNSTLIGALSLALGTFTLKGEARRNAMAVGVGMMVPTVGHVITGGASSWSQRTSVYGSSLPLLWGGNGNGNGAALPEVAQVNGGARGYTSRVPSSNPFLTTSRGLNVA